MSALQFHPAFVSSRLFDGLPFANLLPDLTLEVDSIAEGVDTVGVEWHVQCGDSAFPLGRGLSQASVCTETGKIRRVVDIAEAPWRVIGLMALPFINAVNSLNALRTGRTPVEPVQPPPYKPLSTTNADATAADPSMDGVDVEREYRLLLTAVLADGIVDPAERAMLAEYAAENRVSDAQHDELLRAAGWSADEYNAGVRRSAR